MGVSFPRLEKFLAIFSPNFSASFSLFAFWDSHNANVGPLDIVNRSLKLS